MLNITISDSEKDKDLLSHRDFEVTQEFTDAPENTFYVAQDEDGKVHGTVLINPNDRKATGALVGNWIANGLAVNRMPYKHLARILRAAEAAKKSEAEPSPQQASAPAAAPAAQE